MRAALKAIILVPVSVLLIVFAVVNRAPVTLLLDPFDLTNPPLAITAPLFIIIFLSLMVGIAVGGVGVWISQAIHRQSLRHHKREAERYRNEIEELRRRSDLPPLPPAPMIG